MNDLTAEFAATSAKLPLIVSANRIRIVSCFCSAPKLVAWVSI